MSLWRHELRPDLRWDKEELAWAAGIFEGEGCLHLHQKWTPAATVRMTDLDIVQGFGDAVGMGTVGGPYQPNNPNWKPIWSWNLRAYEGVQQLVILLWPWLGARRRATARIVLAAQRDRPMKRSHKLNQSSVRLIRERWATGEWTQQDLADEFGLRTHRTIGEIVNRKTYKHVA